MAEKDYRRDALRILFLLVEGGKDFRDPAFPDYVKSFHGEMRLQALDFWMRYPDYLAFELLSQFRESGDQSKFEAARLIFTEDEPDIRRVPMLRKHFGAYEPLATVLGILKSRALVLERSRGTPAGTEAHNFIVSKAACRNCEFFVEEVPALAWYRDRARLILDVAAGRSGADLKKRQHEHKEYHEARIDDLIPTIADRVRRMMAEMEGA